MITGIIIGVLGWMVCVTVIFFIVGQDEDRACYISMGIGAIIIIISAEVLRFCRKIYYNCFSHYKIWKVNLNNSTNYYIIKDNVIPFLNTSRDEKSLYTFSVFSKQVPFRARNYWPVIKKLEDFYKHGMSEDFMRANHMIKEA